ncbi:MAG: hypothetical protein QXS20_09645 [Candidatus Thorarchaeota archaeon]
MLPGTLTRDWYVNIVLVNYDPSVIVESVLLACLPDQRQYYLEDLTIKYLIHYNVVYANGSYAGALTGVALANSRSGVDIGTRLDVDALLYQREHPSEPQRIFYPRAGMSIDADAIEAWLLDNPAVPAPTPGYTVYLLNFSEFDSPGWEHWFDYNPVDPDSGQRQDWFRLEWDNSLNPNVVFHYPGFGGKRGNIYVLDPSANQWYLRWASIWWEDTEVPPHTVYDLDAYSSLLDLHTQGGRETLSTYLGNYLHDPLGMVMFPYQHEPAAYVSRGNLKTLVFCMDVEDGISIDSLRWITNEDLLRDYLRKLMPFVKWNVDVEFSDIRDHPDWEELFWDYAQVVGGKTVVDGLGMFEAIYMQMRSRHVDVSSTDINVFGVVFVKKNMVMYVYGGTFTGLGGGGQTVIWKSWERYYRDDGVTPKSGVSLVQLHETMHAIGIMHTWTYGHYVGDFCSSPMVYHAFHNGTSVYDDNFVQSTYLDQMWAEYMGRYQRVYASISGVMTPRAEFLRQKALEAFAVADSMYCNMNWTGCFDALKRAWALTSSMMYCIYDDRAPEIVSWGMSTETDNDTASLTVWAYVRDDMSGIENVTVVVDIDGTENVFMCQTTGSNWTVQIPRLYDPTSVSYVAVRVVALDMALNMAETDWSIVLDNRSPWGSWVVPALTVGTIVSAAAVVVVFARSRHPSGT